ncbi:MAG: adenylate/guanylate cyclase domain-containing protein [Desulfobacterales bacterium]
MDKELEKFLGKESRDLMNFIYDGVYVVDIGRKIVFWNKGAERITGYSADEVMGKYCKDNILNHLDENGTLVCKKDCPLLRAINEDRAMELKLYPLHKSGRRIPVSTHIGPIKSEDGRIIGAIEVFRDISADENLRIMDEKFKKLIRQYVSETTFQSVQKAVAEDADTVASLKDLTVLFMDLVGFTSISEALLPENTVYILNTYFNVSSHIIRQHSGDIDKYIGDCVMAIFIDANDAVAAAGEILNKGLPGANAVLKKKGFPQIRVRIGINSGQLVHGDIGSKERRDMTVIGDVVNTASRVESVCDPGSFLITESTWSRLKNPQDFVFAKELLLKGKTVQTRLYRLRQTAGSHADSVQPVD